MAYDDAEHLRLREENARLREALEEVVRLARILYCRWPASDLDYLAQGAEAALRGTEERG